MSRRKYPWDKWLRQSRFRLEQGRHYDCRTYSMAQQVRNAAFVRGASVSIRIEGDVILVRVTVPTED